MIIMIIEFGLDNPLLFVAKEEKIIKLQLRTQENLKFL